MEKEQLKEEINKLSSATTGEMVREVILEMVDLHFTREEIEFVLGSVRYSDEKWESIYASDTKKR